MAVDFGEGVEGGEAGVDVTGDFISVSAAEDLVRCHSISILGLPPLRVTRHIERHLSLLCNI
jgi:hypothetical protein